MPSDLKHRSILRFDRLSPRDITAVLDSARALQRVARDGAGQPLLRGKNLGLLCEVDEGADATAFRCAAVELGAHVAHIRPSLSERSTAQEVRHTARMLGLLYDAVECQGMPSALVRRVGIDAGVPVYDAISSPDSPMAGLAELLDERDSLIDRRHFMIQALLLSTIG